MSFLWLLYVLCFVALSEIAGAHIRKNGHAVRTPVNARFSIRKAALSAPLANLTTLQSSNIKDLRVLLTSCRDRLHVHQLHSWKTASSVARPALNWVSDVSLESVL